MENENNWNAFRSSLKGKGYSQSQIRSMYKSQLNVTNTKTPSKTKTHSKTPLNKNSDDLTRTISLLDNTALPDEIIKIILTETDYDTAVRLCQVNKRLVKLCEDNPDLLKPLKYIKIVSDFKNKHNITIKCEDDYSKSPDLLKSFVKAIVTTDNIIKTRNDYRTNKIKVEYLDEAFPELNVAKDYDKDSLTFYVAPTKRSGPSRIIVEVPGHYIAGGVKIVDIVCGLAYLYNKKVLKFTVTRPNKK